jgi:ABC-type bacteriocin/lantibiotic exporter with double-glycine peptidase domain
MTNNFRKVLRLAWVLVFVTLFTPAFFPSLLNHVRITRARIASLELILIVLLVLTVSAELRHLYTRGLSRSKNNRRGPDHSEK